MTGDTTTGNTPTSRDDYQNDWATKATSTVVQYVGTVRDKTTGPALVASRYAVYVVAIALVAFIVAVVGFLLLVRGIVVITGYAPFVEPGETWLAYYLLGGIFVLSGAFLWRKKEQAGRD